MAYAVLAYPGVWGQSRLAEFTEPGLRVLRCPDPVNPRLKRSGRTAILIDRRHPCDPALLPGSKLSRDHEVERVEVYLVLYRHERLNLALAVLLAVEIRLIQKPYDRADSKVVRRYWALAVE